MAERLKTLNGGVEATGWDDREMIEVGGETGDWESDRRTVSRADVIGVMRPRVEEILENVRQVLDAAGFDYMPSQQIVLTGGAARFRAWTGWRRGFLAPTFAADVRCGLTVWLIS